jgi:hypothetical protein
MLFPICKITTLIYSPCLIAVSSATPKFIVLRIVISMALVCYFVNGWLILIVSVSVDQVGVLSNRVMQNGMTVVQSWQ